MIDDDVLEIERPAPPRRRVALLDLEPRSCRWPIGDPRDDDFGFCGAPAQPGSSYCTECRKIAYRATDRR